MYANFGRAQDFDKLIANGINVTDCIVLTKYGMSGRGAKVISNLIILLLFFYLTSNPFRIQR